MNDSTSTIPPEPNKFRPDRPNYPLVEASLVMAWDNLGPSIRSLTLFADADAAAELANELDGSTTITDKGGSYVSSVRVWHNLFINPLKPGT